jgi:tetratricopeptide (TPR) repeat protein
MEAMGALLASIATNPMEEDILELLIAIGHSARARRRFDDAAFLFDRLATLYPQRAFPYIGLGLVEIDRMHYRKASVLFERAIAAAPDQALPRVWLGASLVFESKYASGARVLMSVAESDDPAARKLAKALLDLPECMPYRSTALTTRSAPTLQQLNVRPR